MTHSDDDGLILPPRIASAHIVIIPVLNSEEAKAEVLPFCEKLAAALKTIHYHGMPIEVVFDKKDGRAGEKSWGWIKKGIPLRLEIGPREVESGQLSLARRDRGHKDLAPLSVHELEKTIGSILDNMQSNLLRKATEHLRAHTVKIDNKSDFYNFFTPKNGENPEIHGGFALCHWSGDSTVEEIVKKDLNVTIRCIPLDAEVEHGKCVISGAKSSRRVIYAKSY
jgi:prolyl-tRNA synthetase